MRLMWIMLFAALGLAAQTKMPNLALNCPAEASSVENQNLLPEFAVDGKTKTRWSSAHRDDPQWFKVDLGAVKTVGRVVVFWETAAAKAYRIQLSLNGKDWTDASVKSDGSGGIEELKFAPVQARFVRLYCEKRLTKAGYSVFEFEVYSE